MGKCGKILAMSFNGAGFIIITASTITDYPTLYIVMLLNAMFYMPYYCMNNATSYIILEKNGYNIVKIFLPSVFGNCWIYLFDGMVDLSGWTVSPMHYMLSAGSGILLGIYAFTLPRCTACKKQSEEKYRSSLGLDAFVLFKRKKMAIFFYLLCF